MRVFVYTQNLLVGFKNGNNRKGPRGSFSVWNDTPSRNDGTVQYRSPFAIISSVNSSDCLSKGQCRTRSRQAVYKARANSKTLR